jgi:hypothetical protein
MAIKVRDAQGRIGSATVCGRRHCRVCKKWRHVFNFSVNVWADAEKTRPRYLRSECHVCQSLRERRRVTAPRIREAKRQYDRLRYHERKLERAALCAWCRTHPHGEHSNICSTCDDEQHGWVELPNGAWVEEGLLADVGFDHGYSGVAAGSPLGLALTV